ncbi:MAG: transglycosylase SLT domain-containing protein [Deltaproteobacteria bacterium]|nr:transglycosylase SLT domain-containing protein [Deltaproteobacteria bacterium]
MQEQKQHTKNKSQENENDKLAIPPPFKPRAGVFKRGFGEGPVSERPKPKQIEHKPTNAPEKPAREAVLPPRKTESTGFPTKQKTSVDTDTSQNENPQNKASSANTDVVAYAMLTIRPAKSLEPDPKISEPSFFEQVMTAVTGTVTSIFSSGYSFIKNIFISEPSSTVSIGKTQSTEDSSSPMSREEYLPSTESHSETKGQSSSPQKQHPRHLFISRLSESIAKLYDYSVKTGVCTHSRLPDSQALMEQIYECATEQSLDPLFCAAVAFTETDFGIKTKSTSSAKGIYQLLDPAIKDIAKHKQKNGENISWQDLKKDISTDFRDNVKIGIAYLKYTHDNITEHEANSPQRLQQTARAYTAGLNGIKNDPDKGVEYAQRVKRNMDILQGWYDNYDLIVAPESQKPKS